MLTVTSEIPANVLAERHWSVVLAVAQWQRSAAVTSDARERLRAFGVSEAEIECRRRAASADATLAALLRLAVTFVIARGELLASDRTAIDVLALHDEARAAVASVRFALDRAAHAPGEPHVPIDMDIGDY